MRAASVPLAIALFVSNINSNNCNFVTKYLYKFNKIYCQEVAASKLTSFCDETFSVAIAMQLGNKMWKSLPSQLYWCWCVCVHLLLLVQVSVSDLTFISMPILLSNSMSREQVWKRQSRRFNIAFGKEIYRKVTIKTYSSNKPQIWNRVVELEMF